jgi:glucosamine 6-phosphate synthetase-like amidotransferase/phosphosugar isomerase protein
MIGQIIDIKKEGYKSVAGATGFTAFGNETSHCVTLQNNTIYKIRDFCDKCIIIENDNKHTVRLMRDNQIDIQSAETLRYREWCNNLDRLKKLES